MPSFMGTGGGGRSMQGTGGGSQSAMGSGDQQLVARPIDNMPTLQKLNDLFDQARKHRMPFEAQGWLDLSFFLGEQYVEWPEGEKTTSIRQVPRRIDPDTGKEDEDPRPVFNKIQNYIYTAHSETLQDKPSLGVLPATDDYYSQVDADVGRAYLDYVMDPSLINWDLQLSDAALWALVTPAGWLKVIWDDNLGRPDVIPIPFFDGYADPFAKQFQRSRYFIHTMFMDPEVVEDTWQVKLQPGEIGVADPMKVELLRGMGAAPLTTGVVVRELWFKPTPRHPQGMYAVWTPKRILKLENRLPYRHLYETRGGLLPFAQLGSLRRPDALYYTNPVAALRPAQMVWNRFVAQAVMTFNHWANLKWWVPDELQLQKMPDNSPNQVLHGTGSGGYKPEILTPGNIPDNSRMLDIFEQQMMHTVSVHEVSQGQVPGRVEAAKAIELLKSSDEGMYKHLLDTIDAACSQVGYQILMLARQFETEGRQVVTYSPDGSPLVSHFRKGAIQPGTRVRAVRMSGLGRTRAQRQDALLTLWREHIVTDPEVFAELYDLPIPSFANPRASDHRLARAENTEMAGGTPVVPNSWDNHAIHLREHNEYRKTAEYRSLDEKMKAIFEFHCTRHEQLQLVEARKLAMLMAASQPPMQPGTGSPPAGPGPLAPDQAGTEASSAPPGGPTS